MADRLADNKGTPFNPNKELWGQGWCRSIVPLLNGFPHTGALARTATNIKLGAITPLAGIFKCVLKLLLAAFLASYLELVPMACIGGILLYVAFNMVKPAEVKQVLAHNRFHIALMVYTAVDGDRHRLPDRRAVGDHPLRRALPVLRQAGRSERRSVCGVRKPARRSSRSGASRSRSPSRAPIGSVDRAGAERGGDELIRYARMLTAVASPDVSFRFVHVMGRLVSGTHRAALHALSRAAARHLGSEVAWECHVRRGDRIDQVLHDVAEWGSDLLVIGHRKRARGRRTIARRLAMKAPCSLLLVPEGTARPLRRLMVAVDFSEPSAHAAAVAAALARRGHVGHCLVLHVRTPTAAGERGQRSRARATSRRSGASCRRSNPSCTACR